MPDFNYHRLLSFKKENLEIVRIEKGCTKTFPGSESLKLRKMIFFLFREGLLRSYRKFKSKKTYQSVEKDYSIVTARNKNNSKYYTGFQHTAEQPIYYFLKESERDEAEPEQLTQKFSFNPFLGYIPIDANYKEESFKPISIFSAPQDKYERDLYIIGCGRYVFTEVLPIFSSYNKKCLVDFDYNILKLPFSSEFEVRTNDFSEALRKGDNNRQKLAVIASYHSYHAEQAVEFLKTPNSKIIIEKPPCVTRSDFEKLLQVYSTNRIYIAYHRRFAPWNIYLKKLLAKYNEPVIINILVHEVKILGDHWYFSPNQGTRVSGNLCHWIDIAMFWLDRKPVKISIAKNDELGIDDSVFTIHYDDGSIVNMIATDKGDRTRGVQEYISLKSESLDINIHDYTSMKVWEKGRTKRRVSIRRNKGHVALNKIFDEYINKNLPSSYTRKDFVFTTHTTISFVELYNSDKCSRDLEIDKYL